MDLSHLEMKKVLGKCKQRKRRNLQWSLLTNCQQHASPSLFGVSDRANWVRRIDKKRKAGLELGFVLLLSRVELNDHVCAMKREELSGMRERSRSRYKMNGRWWARDWVYGNVRRRVEGSSRPTTGATSSCPWHEELQLWHLLNFATKLQFISLWWIS